MLSSPSIKIIFIFFAIKDNIAERACCGVPCKCTGTRGDRGAVGFAGTKVSTVKPFDLLCTSKHTKNLTKSIVFVFQGSPGLPGSQGHPGDEGGPVSLNVLFHMFVFTLLYPI